MVFLLQFSLVFARWIHRLTHETIPSKLVKKMPTAFDHYRHLLLSSLATLAWPIRRDLRTCVQAYAQLVVPSLARFTLHSSVFAVVATTIGYGK